MYAAGVRLLRGAALCLAQCALHSQQPRTTAATAASSTAAHAARQLVVRIRCCSTYASLISTTPQASGCQA
ncbi:hypothetical protein COO60DRAFT_856798 [Scenedesmus sp. NREL 46B-D3]|nr:hypothetical protein COO60DRAFT_856798 [Scenedesmus sp. NREL 46B-D3]